MISEFDRKIVQQLASKHSRNEIIRMVCLEQDMRWPEAEAYVDELETLHAGSIASTQRGYLRWMSIGFILAGLMMLLAGTVITLSGIVIIVLRIPIPYLGNTLIFLAGLSLLVGGIVGWYQTRSA